MRTITNLPKTMMHNFTANTCIFIFIVFLILVVFQNSAVAKPYLTVSCENPKGKFIGFRNGKIITDDNSYTGVYPMFVFDDEKKDKVLVLWGNSKKAKKEFELQDKAREALIIHYSTTQITAIATEKGDYNSFAVMVYSFYPKEGLVFQGQHKYLVPSGIAGFPIAHSDYTKCDFAFQ